MRKLLLTSLFLFFVMQFSALTFAAGNISFSYLSTADGLSHYSVLALYQDERGFIWIGTREGLNVYDGSSVKVFKVNKGLHNSINSSYIKGITGNKQGKIFIWTTSGITEYDLISEQFKPIYTGDVTAMYYNEKLYIAIGNSIMFYNQVVGEFETYYQFKNKSLEVLSIAGSEKKLLVGTNGNGLLSIDKGLTENVLIDRISALTIYYGLRGKIWVGTVDNGLYALDRNAYKNYRKSSGDNAICSNYVRSICEDDKGNLWLATFNGLSKFNIEKETFVNYFADEQPGSIRDNSIWGLINDHQGTIWFGTYYGGLHYFNPEYEIFTTFRKNNESGLGISHNIIGQVLEDKYGNVWICTDGGGLDKYDPIKKEFKWYLHQDHENSISHNNTKVLYYDDKKDIMWIGTHLGGLNKLDIKTGKFTNYLSVIDDSTTLPSNIIYDIDAYEDDLIIATKNGVCFFDTKTEKCKKNIRNKFINVVVDQLVDHSGILWLSVDRGLASYDLETNELKFYIHNDSIANSLSNNSVNDIYQDSWNQLWICTSGGGLDLYNYENKNFKNYDVTNSNILSNVVYGILEYSPGKLLLNTDKGLSLFDSRKNNFVNYEFNNDLPISNINSKSVYINEKGKVYAGTTKGMVVFNINKLAFKKKTFNIYPHTLYVNGIEVKPLGTDGILQKSLQYTSKIKLRNVHKAFEIKVAVTNYISANKPIIKHKLEGFDNNWVNTNDQNLISYFNLNPDNYKLIIKAVGNSGEILNQSVLDIYIKPPFYRTTIAYLLYFLIIFSIVLFIFQANSSKIRLQESLKYERKHLNDVNELNQNKLQFFSNISHELLTPLTLIIGQLETLVTSNTFVPSVYKKVISIYRNSKQMQSLIADLLDFRKQESGKMQMNIVENDIAKLFHEAYLSFNDYAESRKIDFSIHLPDEPIYMWFDPKQLLKVINNLLSNSFKHTHQNDRIKLLVENKAKNIIIKVIDTGDGVDEKDIAKIFDRFYQSKDSKGTGIGLALAKNIVELHAGSISVQSKKGEGACFTIELLKGRDHFNDSQIADEKDIIIDSMEPEAINRLNEFEFVESEGVEDKTLNSKVKILIIEDNAGIREMLCDIFKGIYHVVSAEDGEMGLKLVEKENPSIVLSDIVMPKISGTELCKAIKSNIDTCHIPVVLLTARTTSEQYLEGLKYGADDYITKPFNANILVSRCNNLVKSRLILQEKYSNQQHVSPKILATNELDNKFIDQCIGIIEKYLDDPKFNVYTFSREMGMARTKLFNKIKAITGQTPNEFLIEFRLKKAAYMLKNNLEYSIADISIMTGFSSSRYFSKSFKDKYNKSPLTYRND